MASVRNARRALDRGATDEALVLLWNAVEPARLAGDAAALNQIAGLAARIAREGDEAQKREAERLLEVLGETGVVESFGVPEPADVDVEAAEDSPAPEDVAGDEEMPDRRTRRFVNLLWILFLLLVIVVNVLRGVGGD